MSTQFTNSAPPPPPLPSNYWEGLFVQRLDKAVYAGLCPLGYLEKHNIIH